MKIIDDHGLIIALMEPTEALDGPPYTLPPEVSIVRVPDPPREFRPRLMDAGFVCKPAWISWRTEVADDEATWLSRLPRSHAAAMRKARRLVQRDLELAWERPVVAEHLDEFLALYREMINGMEHGVNYAAALRSDILANPGSFLVQARSKEGMVGSCVCRTDEEERSLVMRFPALSPGWRSHSLSRVLYLEVMELARAWGYPTMSLGRDPNLYGHITKSGLFEFKARRMGFVPHVTEAPFGLVPWHDEADLVISAHALSEPALMLGYVDGLFDPKHPNTFTLEVYGTTDRFGDLAGLPFLQGFHRHSIEFSPPSTPTTPRNPGPSEGTCH
ncbi:hypothetical protein GTY83_01020 [Streptomyces sp. SID4928]|uniref:GNAT family N-acetyltransferase n=1 Tax=unclassified Streptomyces TaxID=2593676 RepID=UPI0001C19C2C|nr:GNAT family N-acetyltransferase [Streptomyces sp. ACT-1]EGE39614.1 hypothetical protein SACT1_0205 [Streptomyces sp. ACT-1]MYR47703.1 hypothetical protein [Streptomyces sp. SID4928]